MGQPSQTRSFGKLLVTVAVLAALVVFMSHGLANLQTVASQYMQKYPQITTPSSDQTQPQTQPNAVTSSQPANNTTANWAGYGASGNNFTAIHATWKVPSVSLSSYTAADATWIGIGGMSSNDLIQAGTQNTVTADGQVQTTAFYEMLPDTMTPIDSLNVNPGDSVTTNITETSLGTWDIKVIDNSTGQSFATTVNYDSSHSSAEWIEEAPSAGRGEIPIDNFGSVTFSGASATQNGQSQSIAGANGQTVNLVNDAGEALANVSSLGSNGSSFSVTRTDASPVISTGGSYGYTSPFRRSRGFRQYYNSF